MKKTLLICSVVFLGLSANAQEKKAAVQTPQPLVLSTSVETDKASARKAEAEKQEKRRVTLKMEAEKKEAALRPKSRS